MKYYIITAIYFAIVFWCISLPKAKENKKQDTGLITFEDADSLMRVEYSEIP
jgi:hypothetical protein